MSSTTSLLKAPTLPGLKVTLPRVISSEWTKFRSLRSSLITLLVAVVLTVGLGALISGVTNAHWAQMPPQRRLGFDAASTSLSGVNIAQLAIGVLGVLLMSSEYSTGMIRATLTAVPKRLDVLWAKLVVFGFVAAIAAFASAFAAFFIGQSLLGSHNTSLSAPNAMRMVVGSALYLVVVGILGLAIGAIVRNTAAGISTVVALFFVIPPLMNLLPDSWNNNISPYLPSNAGSVTWTAPHDLGTNSLAPWTGFAVMCIWAAVAVIAAAVRLRRTDA